MIMRHGPSHSSPESRRRPRATPSEPADTREGIRALDCGEESSVDVPRVVRRDGIAAPPAAPADSGALGEQRQSL
jgi:hypothetical protein